MFINAVVVGGGEQIDGGATSTNWSAGRTGLDDRFPSVHLYSHNLLCITYKGDGCNPMYFSLE